MVKYNNNWCQISFSKKLGQAVTASLNISQTRLILVSNDEKVIKIGLF